MAKDKPFSNFFEETVDKRRNVKNKNKKAIENEYGPGNQLPKKKRAGGGDFNIEMKIPKDMVNQGVMYGYKKGGQI